MHHPILNRGINTQASDPSVEKKDAKRSCIATALLTLLGIGLLIGELLPFSPISIRSLSGLDAFGGGILVTGTISLTLVSAIAAYHFRNKMLE